VKLSTLAAIALILLGLWFQFAGPEPPPPPPPTPPPPPPVEELFVLFLHESNDVDDDPWMANILTSQKIRRLESDDVVLLFADDDEKDERGDTPPDTKPWIDHAKSEKWKLPHIIMADQDGRLVHHANVPRTVGEVVELIGRFAP